MEFLLGKKYIVKHQKITTNHTHTQKTSSSLMILVLFYEWEDARF